MAPADDMVTAAGDDGGSALGVGAGQPRPAAAGRAAGDRCTRCGSQGPLTFRHEAQPGAAGELCGHHHPKATVATRAGVVTRSCFVTDPRRVMLPAMGAYTGGLDVTHPAIARLFPRGGRTFLQGSGRLFSFTLAQLRGGPGAQALGPPVALPAAHAYRKKATTR